MTDKHKALKRYVAALARAFPAITVRECPPDEFPQIVELDGWVTISEADIEVVQHSILGDKVSVQKGYVIEYTCLIPGSYWEPDDVDVVEHEQRVNASDAAESAYVFLMHHAIRQALQATGEDMFADGSWLTVKSRRSDMRYFTCFGAVYRLSDKNAKAFLEDAAAGKPWNLDDYGDLITVDTVNVTDLTPEQARDLLNVKPVKYRLKP